MMAHKLVIEDMPRQKASGQQLPVCKWIRAAHHRMQLTRQMSSGLSPILFSTEQSKTSTHAKTTSSPAAAHQADVLGLQAHLLGPVVLRQVSRKGAESRKRLQQGCKESCGNTWGVKPIFLAQ